MYSSAQTFSVRSKANTQKSITQGSRSPTRKRCTFQEKIANS
ncbi:unnamed protein product [Onchocerca flexuosa]|uniref:Uncharacterized protein n=1 Tax=Onchocerca flexuosa TaxID=387005 RepID=A0A183I8B1_9BILA|nr:unnamed protein product [Onchocerca flexuosa]